MLVPFYFFLFYPVPTKMNPLLPSIKSTIPLSLPSIPVDNIESTRKCWLMVVVALALGISLVVFFVNIWRRILVGLLCRRSAVYLGSRGSRSRRQLRWKEVGSERGRCCCRRIHGGQFNGQRVDDGRPFGHESRIDPFVLSPFPSSVSAPSSSKRAENKSRLVAGNCVDPPHFVIMCASNHFICNSSCAQCSLLVHYPKCW